MAWRLECDVCGEVFSDADPGTEEILAVPFRESRIKVTSELDICPECLGAMAEALKARQAKQEQVAGPDPRD